MNLLKVDARILWDSLWFAVSVGLILAACWASLR
jgi:hypothetical protein